MPRSSRPLKLVVVGDPGVGRTCLIHTFDHGNFPTDFIPTVYDSLTTTVRVGASERAVEIFDTAGQDEFLPMRRPIYPETDLFLICASVVDPSTFDATAKWVRELRQQCKDPQYVLVGLKTDLRLDDSILLSLAQQNLAPYSQEEGIEKAREIDALTYLECSALLNTGVRDVFESSCAEVVGGGGRGGAGGCCGVY
jgi:small GTP-binding protein